MGSEARKSEKQVSPVELRELKSITSRCLVGELVFNRRTLLELRSPASVTHGEVPISARAFCQDVGSQSCSRAPDGHTLDHDQLHEFFAVRTEFSAVRTEFGRLTET